MTKMTPKPIKIKEKDWQTTGNGQSFEGIIPQIVLGCKHKNIYQGFWFRGMCMDCGEYQE